VAVLSEPLPINGQKAKARAPRAGFDAWWTLVLTFLLNLVSYLDRTIVAMLVPNIKHSLTASDFQVGLLLGPTFAVCFSLFAIPLGWAADRLSRRMVIALGAIVFGAATIISGFAPTFLWLLVTRALVAIGEASLGPAALSLISEKFPRNLMTTAVSIYSMGLKIGGAAALGLGAVAIVYAGKVEGLIPGLNGAEPWRLVFAITGLPAVALGLLVFTFRESPKRDAAAAAVVGETETAVQFLWSNWRLFAPMLLGFSLLAMCGQTLIGWAPTLMGRQFGMAPAQYGPLLGGIALVSSLTLVVKGGVMDWFYARGIKDIHVRFYTWLLFASVPLVAVVFFASDLRLFVPLYAVVAIVTVPLLAYLSVTVQMVAPRGLRGRLTAVVGIPISLVGGLGPLTVGALTDFVFRDESRLNASMATLFCLAVPIALVLLRLTLRPLREAVVRCEARERADDASD
jgi:MFS family permease